MVRSTPRRRPSSPRRRDDGETCRSQARSGSRHRERDRSPCSATAGPARTPTWPSDAEIDAVADPAACAGSSSASSTTTKMVERDGTRVAAQIKDSAAAAWRGLAPTSDTPRRPLAVSGDRLHRAQARQSRSHPITPRAGRATTSPPTTCRRSAPWHFGKSGMRTVVSDAMALPAAEASTPIALPARITSVAVRATLCEQQPAPNRMAPDTEGSLRWLEPRSRCCPVRLRRRNYLERIGRNGWSSLARTASCGSLSRLGGRGGAPALGVRGDQRELQAHHRTPQRDGGSAFPFEPALSEDAQESTAAETFTIEGWTLPRHQQCARRNPAPRQQRRARR